MLTIQPKKKKKMTKESKNNLSWANERKTGPISLMTKSHEPKTFSFETFQWLDGSKINALPIACCAYENKNKRTKGGPTEIRQTEVCQSTRLFPLIQRLENYYLFL